MKLNELYEGERPREKMLSLGPRSLGTPELLAILLRTGTRERNVVDLGHQLLASADGSLLKLSSAPLEALCRIPGIKKDKAATLMAAFELGRRFLSEASWLPATPVTTPEQVYRMMIPRMKGLSHEECWVVLLNRAQYPIAREQMSFGGTDTTTIVIKDILKRALDHGAHGIILVHNHPAGNPHPSAADVTVTQSLERAARAMEMVLYDHVIVADDCFYSYSEDRLVTEL